MPRHASPAVPRIFAATALSLAVLVGAPASGVGAQDVDTVQAAAARSLFSRGLASADAEAWQDAVIAFRQALALRSSPVIELNLGLALASLGQVVEASEHVRAVLRAPELEPALRTAAERALPAIESRIAWVRLHVDGPLEGRSLLVDGRAADTALARALIPLDPGHHTFEVHEGRRVIARVALDTREGVDAEVPIHLPPPVGESTTALLDPW